MIHGELKGHIFVKEIVIFVVYTLIIMITVMVLQIIGKKRFDEVAGGFHSLLDNWKKDFVYDIKTVAGTTNCPSSYDNQFQGYWPGTVIGCNCLHVHYCSRKGVSYGRLESGSCNSNETYCGCDHVSSTPERDLINWKSANKVCFQRKGGFNFYSLFKNMNIDGQCKEGFRACGLTTGISKGVCIPNEVDCPITKIEISENAPSFNPYQEQDLNQAQTKKIYFTNKTVDQPIIDTVARFGEACLNPADLDKNGRSDYVLKAQGSVDCKVDQRYSKHSPSEGERTFFDLNNVIYLSLPAFNPTDNDRYYMMSRQLIEWSPKCHDIIQSLYDLQTDVTFFQKRLKFLKTFTIIILILNIVLSFIDLCFCLDSKNRKSTTVQKNCIIPVRNIMVVIAVIFQITCTVKASKLKGIFQRISEEKCSDDFTNSFFLDLENSIRVYLVTFQIISAVLYSFGCCLEFWVTIICHFPRALGNCCKKSVQVYEKVKNFELQRTKTLKDPKNVPIKPPPVDHQSLRNRNKNPTYNMNDLMAKPPGHIPSSTIQPYSNMNYPQEEKPLNPPMQPMNPSPVRFAGPTIVHQPVIIQPVYVQPVPYVVKNPSNQENNNIKISDDQWSGINDVKEGDKNTNKGSKESLNEKKGGDKR